MLRAIVELSLILSPVILLTLLWDRRFGGGYTSGARALLWLILAVRLLIPMGVTGQRPFTIGLPAEPLSTKTDFYLPRLDHGRQPEDDSQPATASSTSVASAPRAGHVLGSVWLLGALCVLGSHILAYFSARRRILRWAAPVTAEDTLALHHRLCREYGLASPIPLFISHGEGPLLMGFLRPVICLPRQPMSAAQTDAVLRHELTHYTRRDLWRKLLLLLAAALHWFNPLVHRMHRQADMDIELACDAAVLQNSGTDYRRQYGQAILAVLERESGAPMPLTTGFFGQKDQMLRRFSEIMDSTKRRSGRWALALVCGISLCCGIFVGCDSAATAEAVPSVAPDVVEVTVRDTDSSQAEPQRTGDMLWPLTSFATVSSNYGARADNRDFHTGVDLEHDRIDGQPVLASEKGTVVLANTAYTPGTGYGIYVILDHGDGLTTLYAHLRAVDVQAGDTVQPGQKIGQVGDTGYADHPHLHFEVRINGEHTDPLPYITIGESPATEPPTSFLRPTAVPAKPTTYKGHSGNGVDYAGDAGEDIFATADGVVLQVVEGYTGYGHYLIVDHGFGYQSLYAQCSEITAAVGDVVKAGDVIAKIGRTGWATGNHLHFELRLNGEFLDPTEYVSAE